MANYTNPYYGKSAYIDNERKRTSSTYETINPQRTNKQANENTTISSNNAPQPVKSETIEKRRLFESQPTAKFLSFERDDIVKGIIFSEILGKPKGRRMGR